jgi:hypothetical protein
VIVTEKQLQQFGAAGTEIRDSNSRSLQDSAEDVGGESKGAAATGLQAGLQQL